MSRDRPTHGAPTMDESPPADGSLSSTRRVRSVSRKKPRFPQELKLKSLLGLTCLLVREPPERAVFAR